METTVDYLGDVKFAVTSRGHKVVCDQPPENAGTDTGMSPPEFLLAALGTCAGYYAAQYCKARSLPAEGLKVRVTAEKLLKPARLDSFRIEVTVPGLEGRHVDGVLRAVKSCLIANTLLDPPSIETAIETGVLAQA